MPKFLHTSDIHLNSLRRFDGYLRRVERTLLNVLRIAQEENVDFIVAAGDIYDRLDIHHAERGVLSNWLASSSVPILIISGNHDTRSSEVGDTALNYLSSLSDQFSAHYVYDGLPKLYRNWGCQFLLFPFRGWIHQEIEIMISSMLRRASRSSDPIIAVMHEAVCGAVSTDGHEIVKRNQISVDGYPEVCYWALGDMHDCQSILANAWYSGSPHQTDFRFPVGKQGVLIVDTDNPTAPKFVLVESTPLVEITEIPETWPSEDEMFGRVNVGVRAGLKLPPNMELHPSAHTTALDSDIVLSQSPDRVLGVFAGLRSALYRAGLREDLIPKAFSIAKELSQELDLNAKIPEEELE